MFRRLIIEDSTAVFTIVAFVTAATIYVMFAWRAFRMPRPQRARFENLPFATATPVATGSTQSSAASPGADKDNPSAPHLSFP